MSVRERPNEVQECRTRLAAIRAQIADLQREEQALENKLQGLVHAMAPIYRVQDDILREIFLWTLPTPHELVYSTDSVSIRHWSFPMRLCQVCKHWNSVAKDCASLWSSLRLFVAEVPEDKYSPHFGSPLRPLAPTRFGLNRVVQGISNCLSRWVQATKSSPLQLQIISVNLGSRYYDGGSTSIFSAIQQPTFRRITKLTLCSVPFHLVVSLSPGSFPLLEYLVLKMNNISTTNNRYRSVKAFVDCPQLHRVAVYSLTDEDGESIVITFPWSQLSHLVVIRSLRIQHYRQYLSNCPRLEYFLLAVPGINKSQARAPVNHFQWPNLVNLTVDWCQFDEEGGIDDPDHFFVDDINVATLKSLRLSDVEWSTDPEIATPLLRWIASMKSLRYLSLSFPILDDEAYISIFNATPQLKMLDIQLQWGMDAEEYDPFAALNQHPELLPELSKLVLEVTPNWNRDFNMAQFLNFVRRRMDPSLPGARLTHIWIRLSPAALYYDKDAPRLFHELDEFRDAGLVVEIHKYCGREERALRDEKWWWVDRDPVLVEEWPEARELFAQPFLKKSS